MEYLLLVMCIITIIMIIIIDKLYKRINMQQNSINMLYTELESTNNINVKVIEENQELRAENNMLLLEKSCFEKELVKKVTNEKTTKTKKTKKDNK